MHELEIAPEAQAERRLSRRQFMMKSCQTTGALLLSVPLVARAGSALKDLDQKNGFFESPYFKVTPDNQFTLVMDKADMGQGTTTLFVTLFAEEADIAPTQINVVTAGVDDVYGTMMGLQITGGSTSTAERFLVIREAGAYLRAAMVQSAALQWGVDSALIQVKDGVVSTREGGQRATYGDLTAAAEKQRVKNYLLKTQDQWRYIGKLDHSIDALEKVTGRAKYGIDFDHEDLVAAVVVRPPNFSATLEAFDASTLKDKPGFVDCFPISSGVAIVFEKYWQCDRYRGQLNVQWHSSASSLLSSKTIYANFKQSVSTDSGSKVHRQGDFEEALSNADSTLEAEYQLPYLAHATMEPMNCSAWFQGDRLDIWSPNQIPTLVRNVGADISGLSRKNVHVHTTQYLGGGFGRRSTLDYHIEAVEITKKLGKPVKLIWSREDDTKHSPMRPISYHRFKGSIRDGRITGWQHYFAGQSIMGQKFPLWMPNILGGWVPGFISKSMGRAATAFAGAPTLQEGTEIPYAIAHQDIRAFVQKNIDIPVHFWRAVGHSITGFVTESFFDELALAAGQDPLAARQATLSENPRALGVLNRVAEMANWTQDTKNKGIAYHKSFDTYVAQVAEVSIDNGQITVEKVYCAVDCGVVVNPHIVRDQMRSGIIYGLSAALYGEITIEAGAVQQGNFDTYPCLRINACPDIEVSIVESDQPPTGVGEPGLPPVAAAVGNAIFQATGQRLRNLPFRLASPS